MSTGSAVRALFPVDADRWLKGTFPGFSCFLTPPVLLPEDAFDRQPLSDGGLVLVGDIRLDNRDELANLLGWQGQEVKQKADSELFLAAWQRWGRDALRYVAGGFGVAIWDTLTRELTLIRDHVGERPVYYLHTASLVAFASLPAPLRAVPGVDTSFDDYRMVHYLAIVPAGPTQTFFKNIHLLPPGHFVVFRDGRATLTRYWHPLDAPKIHLRRDDEYVEAFRELFDRAVGARLRTTGDVGSQLSGGMDSSSVSATAARLLGQKTLTCFTSIPQKGFGEENPTGRFGNEGPAAARLAAMYPNIHHVLIDSSNEDLVSSVHAMGRLQGHPVFNPTNHLWFKAILDECVRRGITSLMQAACGNATISFGGMVALSEFFRRGKWLKLATTVLALHKRGHISWRGAASFSTGPLLPEWVKRRLNQEQETFTFAFSPVHPAQAVEHQLAAKTRDEFYGGDASAEGFRRNMFDYYDTGFVTAATELGWGISLRDPTQDRRVFEYCFAIPIEQYLVGGQTRSLVRRAMRGRLPDETLDCTTRGLQSADWFLTVGASLAELKQELKCIQQSPTANRLLDLDRLANLLETWPSEGYELDATIDSYDLALTRGLSAGNFIRQFE